MGIYNRKPFVIFEFAEGGHLKHPNDSQKKQLIKRVAELQTITKHYRPKYRRHRLNYTVDNCRTLARRVATDINTANATAKLKWFEAAISELRLPRSLPKGICHCDFHFSNVLFKHGRFNALIDFDDANHTFLVSDLAGLINPFIASFNWKTWPGFKEDDNVLHFREASRTVSEYMKHRPLSKSEKWHLFDVFKLSVMFDCIWFFSRGNAKSFYEGRKIAYLDSIGRDNFHRALFVA